MSSLVLSQGILDVLVSEWGPSEGGEGSRIAAFRQSLSEDHAFLKVLGKCGSHFLSVTSRAAPTKA